MSLPSKLAGWLMLAVPLAAAVMVRGGAASQAPDRPASAGHDWPTYLGDNARTHYSPLRQITRANVEDLELTHDDR